MIPCFGKMGASALQDTKKDQPTFKALILFRSPNRVFYGLPKIIEDERAPYIPDALNAPARLNAIEHTVMCCANMYGLHRWYWNPGASVRAQATGACFQLVYTRNKKIVKQSKKKRARVCGRRSRGGMIARSRFLGKADPVPSFILCTVHRIVRARKKIAYALAANRRPHVFASG